MSSSTDRRANADDCPSSKDNGSGARGFIAHRATVILVGVVACASGGQQDNQTATWAIDCVAVLGASQPTPLMTLSAVPVSGLPREKLIGELTDDELGFYCDFSYCQVENGYRQLCTPGGSNAPSVMNGPLGIDTCQRTPSHHFNGEYTSLESRESCVSLLRAYSSTCSVGLYEDCDRELAIQPLGILATPSCEKRNLECTR